MNLLLSINNKFVTRLATVLLSTKLNTYARELNVYVLQKEKLERTEDLERVCKQLGMNCSPVKVNDQLFSKAPVIDRYPTTIYYCLLVHRSLPQDLHKILYLDADILYVSDFSSLYEASLEGYLYASVIYTNLTNTTKIINKIRLQNFDADGYYNSGVLLMNPGTIRKKVKDTDIFNYIRIHTLLLPDQDVLDALYGRHIKSFPDQLYNFDARRGGIYETISFGERTTGWVVCNTVILYYCGRDKPWLPTKNSGRHAALYKNYFQTTNKLISAILLLSSEETD